jgi:hypothetical protein
MEYKIIKSKTINIYALNRHHHSMTDDMVNHDTQLFINFEKEVEKYLNKGFELVNEAKFILYNDKTSVGCFMQTIIKKS